MSTTGYASFQKCWLKRFVVQHSCESAVRALLCPNLQLCPTWHTSVSTLKCSCLDAAQAFVLQLRASLWICSTVCFTWPLPRDWWVHIVQTPNTPAFPIQSLTWSPPVSSNRSPKPDWLHVAVCYEALVSVLFVRGQALIFCRYNFNSFNKLLETLGFWAAVPCIYASSRQWGFIFPFFLF